MAGFVSVKHSWVGYVPIKTWHNTWKTCWVNAQVGCLLYAHKDVLAHSYDTVAAIFNHFFWQYIYAANIPEHHLIPKEEGLLWGLKCKFCHFSKMCPSTVFGLQHADRLVPTPPHNVPGVLNSDSATSSLPIICVHIVLQVHSSENYVQSSLYFAQKSARYSRLNWLEFSGQRLRLQKIHGHNSIDVIK